MRKHEITKEQWQRIKPIKNRGRPAGKREPENVKQYIALAKHRNTLA